MHRNNIGNSYSVLAAINQIEAMNQKRYFEPMTIDSLNTSSQHDIVAKKAKCDI